MFFQTRRLLVLAGCMIGLTTNAVGADTQPVTSAASTSVASLEPPMFVAVGYALQRLVSRDGIHWAHQQASPEKGQDKDFLLRGVAYGQGKIVAVGGSRTSRILVSDSNGQHWKDISVVNNWLGDVAYGNEKFVAVGYQRAMHSADGLQWSTAVPLKSASWRRVIFGNDCFVAIGGGGSSDQPAGWYATSTDGATWTEQATDRNLVPHSIAFGAGRFVAVGSYGLRESSRDGKTWEHRTLGEEQETLLEVIWSGNEFIAWGSKGAYTSSDGMQWSPAKYRLPSRVAVGDNTFVGCSSGRFSHSTDGLKWTPVTTTEKLQITKIIYVPRP